MADGCLQSVQIASIYDAVAEVNQDKIEGYESHTVDAGKADAEGKRLMRSKCYAN